MRKAILLVLILLTLISCSTTKTVVVDNPYAAGTSLAEKFIATGIDKEFYNRNGRNPVIVVGLVSSSLDVDTSQLIRGYMSRLLSQGTIDLIIESSERDTLREERLEQLNWGNMEQAKSLANEMVADYFGRLFLTPSGDNFIIDADMVEVETGRIVWVGHGNELVALSSIVSQPQTSQKSETKAAEATSADSKSQTSQKSEEKAAETTSADSQPQTRTMRSPSGMFLLASMDLVLWSICQQPLHGMN